MEANEILMRAYKTMWVVLLTLCSIGLAQPYSEVGYAPVVRVSSGELDGRRMVFSIQDMYPVYQYLGVPYATPPTGRRRFRPPHTPVPSWDKKRLANKFGPACPQRVENITESTPYWDSQAIKAKKPFLVNMDEDCLYLNIYVPERDETSANSRDLMAVMMYIHGDTYSDGAGSMYDGSILASYGDVIVITFNYRLGIFGFLSTGDAAARGNYGLMDQAAAIKWVHENIGQFGGDPNKITLFGVGSGAACAGLLMLSNHTRGLISGVIAESGAAMSPWALSREPARFANTLARSTGCKADTSLKTVECLRDLEIDALLAVDIESPLYMHAFAPVIDEDVIEKDPSILWGEIIAGERDLGRKDISYLSGVVRNEAFSYLDEDVNVIGSLQLETFNEILDGFVQNNFGGIMKARVIRDIIYYEYVDWAGGEGDDFLMTESIQDLLTDHQWVAPCIKTLKMADEAGFTTFLYLFPHRPRKSFFPRWAGAVHLEEVQFVFGAPISPDAVGIFSGNSTSSESALSLAIMNYWSNFAKSGNPNKPRPQSASPLHRNFVVEFNYQTLEAWPQYTEGTQHLIYLATNPRVRDFYRAHKISVWEYLVPQIEQKFAHEPPVNLPPYEPCPVTCSPNSELVTISSETVELTSDLVPNVIEMTLSNEVMEQGTREQKGFIVELSMVLAIGGFLLLLNLIVLGAIYYLRDKRKIEKRLAMKYLASQSEEKKRTSLHPQTTPDSGIGIPVPLTLSQQSGHHHATNHRPITSPSTLHPGSSQRHHGNGGSRDYSSLKYDRSPQHFVGAIRRNSAGEVEFEV